jgi:hypothetical protein
LKAKDRRVAEYATHQEFCAIFQRDMSRLYLLALLLTADPKQAEQVFIDGLASCINGTPVFKAWAPSWARRAILESAIRVLRPASLSRAAAMPDSQDHDLQPEIFPGTDGVLRLATFERFVFVMCILLKLPDRESAILLSCTVPELLRARRRVFRNLAEGDEARVPALALQMAV